jgi:hypothetical protein
MARFFVKAESLTRETFRKDKNLNNSLGELLLFKGTVKWRATVRPKGRNFLTFPLENIYKY